MKKNFYILILTTIFICIYSCTKDDLISNKGNGGPQFGPFINPLDSVGLIHNEALEYYRLNFRSLVEDKLVMDIDSVFYLKRSAFDNCINAAISFGTIRGYNIDVMNQVRLDIVNIYNHANMFTNINGEAVVKFAEYYWDDIINAMIDLNNLDSLELSYILPVVISAQNDSSLAYSQSLIDSIPLQGMSPDTLPKLFAFCSIWNHSRYYWIDQGGYQIILNNNTKNSYFNSILTDKKKKGWKPDNNQKLIMSDALGAGIGLVGGNVGVIIGTAVFSMAEAEDQKNNNSVWDSKYMPWNW
jgi:hypothetical protein